MADYAEEFTDEEGNKAPPPPELSLAWQVERWGVETVLGTKEPPAKLLKRITAAMSYYQAFQTMQQHANHLAKWAEIYPSHYALVSQVRVMRSNHA